MKWIRDFESAIFESSLVKSEDGSGDIPDKDHEWINGSYRGSTGDQLHAFAAVGNLNKEVNAALAGLKERGIQPDVLEVRLEVVPDGKSGPVNSGTMKWSVLVGPSSDGKSYRGITSCGSCCTKDAASRAWGQVKKLKTWNSKPERHALVADINNVEAGGVSAKCSDGNGFILVPDGRSYRLRQLFYKYY